MFNMTYSNISLTSEILLLVGRRAGSIFILAGGGGGGGGSSFRLIIRMQSLAIYDRPI